jgi:hypothetical protein
MTLFGQTVYEPQAQQEPAMVARETPIGIVMTPTNLNDDGGRLLSRAEKALLDEAIRRAADEPDRAIILDASSVGASYMGVNLNLAPIAIGGPSYGARWALSRQSGRVGGAILPSQMPAQQAPRETHVLHGDVVHHHFAEPEHVHHGEPGMQRVLAAFRSVKR